MKQVIFCLSMFLKLMETGQDLSATPLIAIQVSEQCGACHQSSRSEVEVWKRRCTLDCQACHIDPNGAGPRNQWGYYFENTSLPSLAFISPPDPLKDSSQYDIHFDGRYIQRSSERSERTFPMNGELSIRIRPFIKWLHLVYQANFLGRIGDKNLRALRDDPRRFQQKYALMIDALPFNLYLRAFRGYPIYGLRHSNHSRWIREKLGFTPYGLVDGLSIGGTPTVPFFHGSLMQGDPNSAQEDRQKGFSYHGGLRGVSLGWHIHGSYWQTESKKASVSMHAVGGGLNLADFIIAGEKNWRTVLDKNATGELADALESQAIRLHPSSRIGDYSLSYVGLKGLSLALIYETLQDSQGSNSSRHSLSLDLHPIPYLQFELWRRFETGSRQLADTLFVGHVYFDF